MVTHIRILITAAFIALLSVVPLVLISSGAVNAQEPNPTGQLCSGADELQFSPDASGDCSGAGAEATETVNTSVALVINIFSWVVGVVSVIMIIYGGFKYITSGGDSSNVTTAKNTILYAIIGLIIVALAQVIVRFVLGTATSGLN